MVLEHVTRLRDDLYPDWPQPAQEGGSYRIEITGEPSYAFDLCLSSPNGDHNHAGLVATAARVSTRSPRWWRRHPASSRPWTCPSSPAKGCTLLTKTGTPRRGLPMQKYLRHFAPLVAAAGTLRRSPPHLWQAPRPIPRCPSASAPAARRPWAARPPMLVAGNVQINSTPKDADVRCIRGTTSSTALPSSSVVATWARAAVAAVAVAAAMAAASTISAAEGGQQCAPRCVISHRFSWR